MYSKVFNDLSDIGYRSVCVCFNTSIIFQILSFYFKTGRNRNRINGTVSGVVKGCFCS